MQNGGWCYSMIPAIKKLYPAKEDQVAALKRHLEFYNTHPYVSSPVIGVTLALEEERANGAPVDDAAIQGVKVGMMGPLAGVGDPGVLVYGAPDSGRPRRVPRAGRLSFGPILFFVLWNVIRMAFEWYTQEFGYKVGSSIAKALLARGTRARSPGRLPSLVCSSLACWSSAGSHQLQAGCLHDSAAGWCLY